MFPKGLAWVETLCPGEECGLLTTTDAPPDRSTEAYADKVFTALLGTMETFSLYLGERLGWLAEMAAGPVNATELAERTGTAERYARSGWRCRRSTATLW